MVEFSVLLLSLVTSVLVVLLLLVYTTFTEGRKLDRLKQILKGTIDKVGIHQDCSYYLGYLVSLPRNRPIPKECMGCSKVFECLENKKSKPKPPEKTLGAKSSQSQVMGARTAKVRKPKTTSTGKTKKKIVSTEAKTKPKRRLQKKKATETKKKKR